MSPLKYRSQVNYCFRFKWQPGRWLATEEDDEGFVLGASGPTLLVMLAAAGPPPCLGVTDGGGEHPNSATQSAPSSLSLTRPCMLSTLILLYLFIWRPWRTHTSSASSSLHTLSVNLPSA